MMPTPKEVADQLVEFRASRDRYKAARVEASRMAVALGMDQKDAIDGVNAVHFLDGFLVSIGMVQKHRARGAA